MFDMILYAIIMIIISCYIISYVINHLEKHIDYETSYLLYKLKNLEEKIDEISKNRN